MVVKQKQLSKKAKTADDTEAMNLVEAALYVSGRPLDTKTLGAIIGTRSKIRVRTLVRSLADKYQRRGGALELKECDEDKYALKLKPSYIPYVKVLTRKPLIPPGPLQTLAYIAYRQPVAQAQIVAIRGTQAYKHIRRLNELGLIATEKLGRTQIIRTTKVFADYFNLGSSHLSAKRQLKSLSEGLNALKAENNIE